jgi:hypothetical protein
MHQYEDDRARYPVSTGAFRRDHWHQVGNDRLNALASNDGIVQVFVMEQGGMFLNHFSHGALVSWLGMAWDILTILILAVPRAIKGLFQPEPGLIARLRTAVNAPGAHQRDDLEHAYAGGFGYIDDGEIGLVHGLPLSPYPARAN